MKSRVSQCYKPLWYAAVFSELSAEQSALLYRLSVHAQRFTSLVSIELPNALLLEIKGSLRLFGSLAHLHASIDAAWQEFSLTVRSATTPSTLASLWCARAGHAVLIDDPELLSGQLRKVPIVCTAWEPKRLQTLSAMGVNYLGELLRLPREGLARRLGPQVVLDLDIALARQPAPRRAFVARERFRERFDFETAIESMNFLESALHPLMIRCAQFLMQRQVGIQTFELQLRHPVGPVSRVSIGLSSVTADHRRLTEVLVQKINRLSLIAPVQAIELISGPLQPLFLDSLDAFEGLNRVDKQAVPHLVERLRARLGESAVYGVCSMAEHRPEAAWRRVYEIQFGCARVLKIADEGMPRPVWLLSEPLLLSGDSLVLQQGPERIESGWWDGKGVARDYYNAQVSGARLWVFQERQSKRWYLHGLFA